MVGPAPQEMTLPYRGGDGLKVARGGDSRKEGVSCYHRERRRSFFVQ